MGFIIIIIFNKNIKLVQCIPFPRAFARLLLPVCSFGFGGQQLAWDLQASRSSATSGSFAGGIPRRDQVRSFNIFCQRVRNCPLGFFTTRKNIHYLLCWLLVGHSYHMAISAQLQLFYAE